MSQKEPMSQTEPSPMRQKRKESIMLQKKKNLLEKLVKKDYNNELEKILEEKQFGENVKSTLLSILYKVEASYKDYQTVKKDVENKEEYISNILEIIKNNCNSIKIIKMSDKENQIPNNKTYIINKEKNEIIAYPIERKILYAISKIGKRDKIIKDEYFLINETLSDLINVGNNIDTVEPLRDFNGYSWTTIQQEIESIEHNLIYQNLRILVGNEFLEKWVKNNEYIIDYYDLFKERLENLYGKKNKEKITEQISKISILLSAKFNIEKKQEMLECKEKIREELQKLQDKEKFIEKTSERKLELSEKIKKIDTTISDKELLQEEYKTRNEDLPLEKKIFSMRILSKIMQQEKEECYKEIEELNKILNPQNFVNYQKEIEEKYKYLEILNYETQDKELEKQKIEFQKTFLNMIKNKITKAETKQEIEKIIFDFRYYLLLPYDYQEKICEVEKLKKLINEVSEKIIDKAIDLKAIERISNNSETNYDILKNIFIVRIINLTDAYLKITKEKDKYFLQIFDENIFEEKVEINKPEELEIKLNKKRPIWA